MHPDYGSAEPAQDAKHRIAEAIKQHLSAKGISRKKLERHDLSLHTINKALTGDFSQATLIKIETILEHKFHATANNVDEASEVLGGYSRRSVENLIGSYIFVRPSFSNKAAISAYRVDISWSNEQAGLCFSENQRSDSKFTQSGLIYMSNHSQFLYLVTTASGKVRNIILNAPDHENILRGVMSTISNTKGALYVPIASPIVICKCDAIDDDELGLIEPSHRCFEKYAALLTSVVAEEYCVIAQIPSADRRRNLSVVG